MVHSEFNPDIYKSLEISSGPIIKNQEMLRFLHDHFKKTMIRKNAVKKLSPVIRYGPDQYKMQEICDKAVSNDPFLL